MANIGEKRISFCFISLIDKYRETYGQVVYPFAYEKSTIMDVKVWLQQKFFQEANQITLYTHSYLDHKAYNRFRIGVGRKNLDKNRYKNYEIKEELDCDDQRISECVMTSKYLRETGQELGSNNFVYLTAQVDPDTTQNSRASEEQYDPGSEVTNSLYD